MTDFYFTHHLDLIIIYQKGITVISHVSYTERKYLYYVTKDKVHPYYTMAFSGIIFIVDIVMTYNIEHKIFSAFSFAFNEKYIVSFYTFYDKLAMIINSNYRSTWANSLTSNWEAKALRWSWWKKNHYTLLTPRFFISRV